MYVDRKRVFDDVYEAFMMLSDGKYVSLYDAQTQVTHWCPDAVRMFGLPSEYFDQGAYNWEDCIHPDDRDIYRKCMMDLTLGKLTNYDVTYRVKIFDGCYVTIRNRGAVIRGENGAPDFIGGNLIDEEVLDKTCPLTGLRNLNGLLFDLNEAINQKQVKNILILGINDFGRTNDAYGYTYGNKYIQKFARLLSENVGEKADVYRLNDVKFAVVSDTVASSEMELQVGRINEELSSNFIVDGILNPATVSGTIFTLDNFEVSAIDVKNSLYALLSEAKANR